MDAFTMFGAGDLGDRVESTGHVCAVPGACCGAVRTSEDSVNLAKAFDMLATGSSEVIAISPGGHASGR
jgi:hypothetical protein